MKKDKPVISSSTRNSSKSVSKKTKKKRSFIENVLAFRWLKRVVVGKTRDESLDLLDKWILKKRILSLFF